MSWLATCPSGSTRIVLARAEIDYVGYQIKRPIAHPISIINLSWSIQSASIYTFNVNAWLVADKTNAVSPCASPAGLFSFEADIVTGRLVSVSPGRLDHYSLINFIEQAQKTYPHRSRSFLEALATQNSSEAAFEFVRIVIEGSSFFSYLPQQCSYVENGFLDSVHKLTEKLRFYV